ncbi:MAG: hypothetical protein OEM63_05825 [Gammaproteobacteria bacterium]|nr:hypothetical protein [Gammaproteobacteria bacterium]
MKHELTCVDGTDYLHLVLCGRLDQSNLRQTNIEIAAAFFESNHQKMLIDVRKLELDTSVIDDFDQASHFAMSFARVPHRIAHLTIAEKLDADQFFETVGLNRGLNIRNFLNEQDAVDWLMTDQATK